MAKRDKKIKKAAAHLAPPAEVTASVVGGVLTVSWPVPVEGATKYSVSVDAAYDTDGDGELETVHDYDIEAAASPVSISLTSFEVPVDADGDGVDDGVLAPKELSVKVKAMNPGKGSGRQNHPFSVPVAVTL